MICLSKVVADTVFFNGKAITVDKDFSIKKSIAIKDGWIIDVGENNEIKEYIGDTTDVIDLGGRTIMPGTCDAHCHAAMFGMQKYCFDCTNDINLPKFQQMIKERVDKAEPGEWIDGTGFLVDSFDEARNDPSFTVTRHDIDKVAPDNPVYIMDAGAHNVMVNTKALEICGITKDTPDPANGAYEKDENGELTGFVVEMGGTYQIAKHMPDFSVDVLKEMILYFQETLVSHGTTSYTDGMAGPCGNARDGGTEGENSIKAHRALVEEGRAKCRASLMYYSGREGVQSAAALEEDLTNNYPQYNYQDMPEMLKVDTVKIFCDGDPTARTAWLYEDYIGMPGYHGTSSLPGDTDEEKAAELHKQIMIAHKHGLKVGVHCEGDRAAGEAIDGMIEAMQAYPGKTPRHYISIEPGKYADLQVLDKDILSVDHEDISSIKTLLTLLAGKNVYATKEFEGVCK